MKHMVKVCSCLLAAVAAVGAQGVIELPEGYTELSYVQCSGDQYLSTGITPSGHETRVEFQTTTLQSDNFILGTSCGDNWNYYSFTEYQSKYVWGRNGNGFTQSVAPFPDTNRHTLIFNRTNDYAVVLDGNVLDSGTKCASTTELFLGRRSSTTYKGRYYSCEIVRHSDGETVRNYVPVRTDAGEVGFYDIVSNEFKTASGSGSFAAGPDRYDFAVAAIPPQSIAPGGSAEPAVTVTSVYDGAPLVAGEQYFVTYENNEQTGVATAFVHGRNEYANYDHAVRFVLEVASPVQATFTWAGGSGDWETPAKWSESALPGPDDEVVIPNAAASGVTDVITVNEPFSVGRLVVGGGEGLGSVKVLFKNGLTTNTVAGGVIVKSGATLTHEPGVASSQVESYKLNLNVGGNMEIKQGGAVDANLCGFATGCGPGGGSGSGGSYGGVGSGGKQSYGSIREPTDLGSGGDGSRGGRRWGGGAVMLDVVGVLTVAGKIVACGESSSGGGGGCGAPGGSIFIKCGTLWGGGTIKADHSEPYQSASWTGSGGRIAIHQRTSTDWTSWTGAVSAYNGGDQGKGGPGTVFWKLPTQTYGSLVICGKGSDATAVCDLSTSVRDLDQPFDTVAVSNSVKLFIRSGVTLKVAGLLDTRNATFSGEDATSVVEFAGEGDATWLGGKNGSLYSVTCTTPGKRIFFGTDAAKDLVKLVAGGKLTLLGSESEPIELLPLGGAGTWLMNVHPDVAQDVQYACVSNSDASAGATILDIGGRDLGGNRSWAFVDRIVPGETNVWTGGASALWGEPANWSRARPPAATDVVRIGISAGGNYPTITSGDNGFDGLIVESGATLTLGGGDVTVSNALRVAGTLVCAGTEKVTLLGDVDFTGGAFACGESTVVLSNATAQAVDLGGQAFNRLILPVGGGDVTFGDGFSAAVFEAHATADRTLAFAAGEIVTLADLWFDGFFGGEKHLKLASTEPGTAWHLKATSGSLRVYGVKVSDSDASAGDPVRVDGTCEGVGENNVNWIFPQTTTTYTWKGGSDAWESANWTVAGENESPYPNSPKDEVLIPRADVEFAITVNEPLNVGTLQVATGSGTAQAKIVFANGLTTNVVAGDVHLFAGAYLTHKVNNSTVKNYVLNLKATGKVEIDANAYINADSAGYASGKGPGGGAGGVYGGKGFGNGADPYGSIREPTDLGSGSTGNANRLGGGAVMLDVGEDLTVNGMISVCGFSSSDGGGGCGGSGGSIFIKTAKLMGTGRLNANHSFDSSLNAYYTGSGGRIAVHQRTATDWSGYTGSWECYGGKSNQGAQGGAGTVFKKCANQVHGELIVAGNGNAVAGQCITPITTSVTDRDEPFDTVTVKGNAQLQLRSGVTLRVIEKIDARSGQLFCADGTAVFEFVGDADATFLGCKASQLYNFRCTVPGKRIYFGTTSSDVLTVPADGNLVLKGSEAAPLELLPLEGAATWKLVVNANAHTDIEYVSVSNSNASAGAAVLAIDSHDLGGNSYWGFSERIRPGQTNAWTGAASTAWGDTANWSRGRGPVETDVIDIEVAASGKYPVLPSGTYVFNQIHVKSGASLTLNGADLTVTNGFTVAGSLVCAGTETVTLPGDASFQGGTLSAGRSRVVLSGAADQAFDPAGVAFYKLYVFKDGGTVTFADGFTAAQLRATATTPVTLAFAADRLVTADECYLDGLVGETRNLTLASTEPDTAWRLKVKANRHAVTGVAVSDSDASAGATVLAGATNADGGDNANWSFAAQVAWWTGAAGTADWATAGNWADGQVPADGATVTIIAADGATVSVRVPATHPLKLDELDLGVTDGTVNFTSDAKVEIASDFEIRKNVTVALNWFDEPNAFARGITIRDGGVLTHESMKKLNVSALGDVTIDAGGRISADSMGYAPELGPKGGKGTSGGMYGGSRGVGCPDAYGSVFAPTDWGAGGGGSKSGGGVILLDVVGTLTVNGAIDSCGTCGGGGGWSGAGGSILVRCGTLSGAGRIRANAVNFASESGSNNQWTGSGGRIAVYQRVARDWSGYTGTILARGGSATDSSGGAGTVYRESAADGTGGGVITVDAYHNTDTYTPIPAPGDDERAYRNAKLEVVKGNVSVTNSVWHLTKGRLHLKDIDLTGAKAILFLCGSTVKVTTETHRGGRGWEGWDKANPTAAYEKHVNEDGGKIVWIRGTVLYVR